MQEIPVAVVDGDRDGIVRQLFPVQDARYNRRERNGFEIACNVSADGFDVRLIGLVERMEHHDAEFAAMPGTQNG